MSLGLIISHTRQPLWKAVLERTSTLSEMSGAGAARILIKAKKSHGLSGPPPQCYFYLYERGDYSTFCCLFLLSVRQVWEWRLRPVRQIGSSTAMRGKMTAG